MNVLWLLAAPLLWGETDLHDPETPTTGGGGKPSGAREFVLDGDSVLLTDLAGKVRMTAGSGPNVVVRATVKGADASLVGFEVAKGELHAIFPDRARIQYPDAGGSTKVDVERWGKKSAALAKHVKGRKSVVIDDDRARGSVECWVDLEVEVPAGKNVALLLGAGGVDASKIDGAVSIDTSRADITLAEIGGNVDVDTGSGDVKADGIRGTLSVDSGSGDIRVTGVRGDVKVDTGSGDVTAGSLEGANVRLDTGSGAVRLEKASPDVLRMDTGSGDITAEGVSAKELRIDTGSGDVHVELTKLDAGKHRIESGSGDVTISLPSSASVRVDAESGSGPIEIAGSRFRHEANVDIGGTGATLDIATGSGRISLVKTEK